MKSLKQPFITDKEIAHIQTMREMMKVLKARLEKLENELEVNEKNGELGSDNKSDYLLFEGINQSTSTSRLKEAFERAKLNCRSWHCCRHSRGTFLHGKTEDKELTMQWLGHSSEKVHNKYLHTYEGLMREIKAKEVEW